MKKKNTTEPQYVTKEILKKEISKSENRLNARIDGVEQRLDAKIDGVEQRLDAKIDTKVDSAVQSMKNYTDSRFTKLDAKIDTATQSMKDYTDSRTTQVQTSIQKLSEKLDTAVTGIVQMLERSIGAQEKVNERMDNHEERITKLEEHSV
ncbi:MAG: hypothetical protein M0Q21_09325 [Ignavibacteriaceae bacterium]|nr:hypothetical protein [Ignavibacteriaceae bacterium]